MSMPFYVAPEQVMKDRADYARKGIARGRSLAALIYADGILICAENPSNTLRKVSEIYDRIAFAGVGKYNEFDQLRIAGVRPADLKGYQFSREDVDARSLANQYAQILGQVFTHEMKPLEVEILVAEVGDDRRRRPAVPHPLRRHGHGRGPLQRPRRRGRGHRRAARGGLAAEASTSRGARRAPPSAPSPAPTARSPPTTSRSRCSTAPPAGAPSAASTDAELRRPPRCRPHRRRAAASAGVDAWPRDRPVALRADGAAHLRPRERVRRHLHAPRPAPAQPRRGRPLPVPPGGVVGPQLQRVPRQRRPPLPRRRLATPSTPRPSATRSTTSSSTTRRASGSSSSCWPSAEQRLREEGIRGVIYLFKNNTDSAGNSYGCHENYLTSRRDDFGHYAEVLIPFLVSPPDLRRRRQGAADGPGRRCTASPSGPSTSGRACRRPPPAAARSSTPATSPTPTPSATAASTSSWATRT